MSEPCTGTPVSWLALERRAVGDLDAREARLVDAHLASCPTCRGCYESIEASEVALAPLAMPAPAPRRSFAPYWALGPAVAFAALVLVWLVRGDDATRTPGIESSPAGIKGGGLAIELVRESQGELLAPTHFASGDRFKVLVTCAPAGGSLLVRVEVAIYQASGVSKPLPPARIRCGNGVALPGAFRLEGGAAKVCVVVDGEPGTDSTACVTVEPTR